MLFFVLHIAALFIASQFQLGQLGTQKRLATEPAYQEQLKRAQNSDGVANHAADKAQRSGGGFRTGGGF
jgi:hypothetical protein